MAGSPFEEHVLEQVSHPGFTIPLVSRADEDSHIDRNSRFAGIGKQQDLRSIG